MSLNKNPPRSTLFEAFHSYLARQFFLEPCLKFGFTPNFITIFSGILGILGALSITIGQPLLECLLINLYAVFDLVDGDIARRRNLKTNFGYWLDIFFDKLIDFYLLFVCPTILLTIVKIHMLYY